MRIQKYICQREKVVNQCKTILDKADASDRDLTAAEQEQLDAYKAEIKGWTSKIDYELQLRADDKNSPPRNVADDVWPGEPDNLVRFADRHTGATAIVGPAKGGKVGARYADLFGKAHDNGGWKSPQDFFAAIHSGMAHPGLQALNEGTGSGGGFMVPETYAAEMLDAAMEQSIVLSRARTYPMTSEVKNIAGFDASTNAAGTLFGGIESQWIGEGNTADTTNPKFRKIKLKAKKLALFCSASNEVAEDGMDLEGQLDGAMRQANGWFLDYAFLRGTGAGQPLGVLNDPALVSVTKESGQEADTILNENLIKMFARLAPGCVNNSVWVANSTCIPQLLTLYAPTALTGQFIPVLRENGGGWQLLTRPVLFTEKLPAVGEKGDILLADFSQYAVGLRREVTLEKSMHVRFMQDETVWRAICRVDGQGRWNKAFTPANGVTQSWAVTLDAR
jgi:HK97 family phage major capsid protein